MATIARSRTSSSRPCSSSKCEEAKSHREDNSAMRLDRTDGSISESPGAKSRGSNSRRSRGGHNCGQRRRPEVPDAVLDFGQVCYVNGWIKNWLFVKRIVADWTLTALVGPSPGDDLNIDYPSSIVEECPLGTETTRPVTEMRARLNAYAKESDSKFIESLPKPANTKKSEEANAQPTARSPAVVNGHSWAGGKAHGRH
jgi:hypothetical protein